jgi:Ca2+-binding EF-hand superfamily protein
MRRFAWLFMTIALISAHGIVAHDQQPLTRKQIMEAADKNRDGKIGRIEFLERMREAFFFVDGNKDGVLTIDEYQLIEGADARRFARADRNKDGKLSLDEFLKAIAEDFDAADANDDGVLDDAEVKAWIAH